MTTGSDIKAVTLTANAKSTAATKAVDLPGLMTQANRVAGELQVLLKQIVAFHPTGGGDASNLSAINAILAALA